MIRNDDGIGPGVSRVCGFSIYFIKEGGVSTMCFKKRVLAVVLAAATIMGSVVSASAATSPTKPTPAVDKYDKNKVDHPNNYVISKLTKKSATVTKVQALKNTKGGRGVIIAYARAKSNNKKAKKLPIVAIASKAFNTKKGRIVTNVTIKSTKQVTVKANAFYGSKVQKIVVRSKIKFNKNAFKGTKVKNLKISINLKKATSVTAVKGAFNGLKGTKVYVNKKMSKAQFNKLKAKLVKAGFKGTIKRMA